MNKDLDFRWFDHNLYDRAEFYKQNKPITFKDLMPLWHKERGWDNNNPIQYINLPKLFHRIKIDTPQIQYEDRLRKKLTSLELAKIINELPEEYRIGEPATKKERIDNWNNQYGRLISTIPNSILQRWGYTHQEKE